MNKLEELRRMMNNNIMYFKETNTTYTYGPWDVDGTMYDFKIIDNNGTDYGTIDQIYYWVFG